MKPWVLLRGLTRETHHWGPFPDRLFAALGERGGCLDLPGNGELNGLPSPTCVTDMVVSARQALHALGHRPPYRLLAMSLGGMVATQWAQQHPQEVDRLVLINTSMRPHSRLTQRLRPQRWPELLAIAHRWHQPEAVEARIHRLTCERRDGMADDVARWSERRRHAPVSAANALRQLWAAARFRAAATAPPCPVLLLSSAHDRLVNPVCTAQVARAWQASHRQHPWAGHDLPHDDAEWVVQQVALWHAGHTEWPATPPWGSETISGR